MANIMTRAAVTEIMSEDLTPEEKTEKVMALYGRALDDGYISKNAAQTAQASALEVAKAEWEKTVQHPDIKASEEYKALLTDFDDYKAMQTARMSDDFKEVKGKFFETVYGMVNRGEGAKPVTEQLAEIRANYEEYFNSQKEPEKLPQFSQNPGRQGVNPTSEEEQIYKAMSETWK